MRFFSVGSLHNQLRRSMTVDRPVEFVLYLGKKQKYDVSIAKNYLSREELQALERIVTMYLDYAEYQAGRHIPMTMQDWSQRLNRFLEFNEHEILHDTGRVTHEIAKAFAESEFEKYRIVQVRSFMLRSPLPLYLPTHFQSHYSTFVLVVLL